MARFRPALIGGIVIGLLSSIPIVSIGNACCCLWVVLGGLLTTPIVNHPEVAILSIGRIADRPVARDGEIQVRPVGTIAVTFDHRVIDGARAAEFGLAVISRLET